MNMFERFAMVDWSGGNDQGARPRKDAIWIAQSGGTAPLYQRNRQVATETLSAVIEAALIADERLLIGFDFPFGYPRGFAHALTGRLDPFAVWQWLTDRIEDTPKQNNRFDLAGQMNTKLAAGHGPFWGNALRRDIAGLPRTLADYQNPFPKKRRAEELTARALTCWQLAGAGAVGSQVLMGLPVLHRLRQRFPGQIAVWPFEALDRPIAFVEVFPSLIDGAVKAATGPADIRDAVQVRLMADALERLAPAALTELLDVDASEEGWIFGLGQEAMLHEAATGRIAA